MRPVHSVGVSAVALVTLLFNQSAFSQTDVKSLAAQSGDLINRHTSPDDIEAGAKLFRSHCSTCHGRNAEGYRGPNLADGRFRHGQSDAALFKNILGGIPGTSMAGVYLADTQVWQIISYLRSFSGTRDRVSAPGDPQRGRIVYEEKGECSSCHIVLGQGGRRGTDLTRIGWQRSLEHILESILEPTNEIDVKYRFIHIFMSSGTVIEGILLNEDTYSVQLMDPEENLVSIYKSGISEIVRSEISLMPDYQDAFTDEELDDLVAYLYSLYGEAVHD